MVLKSRELAAEREIFGSKAIFVFTRELQLACFRGALRRVHNWSLTTRGANAKPS